MNILEQQIFISEIYMKTTSILWSSKQQTFCSANGFYCTLTPVYDLDENKKFKLQITEILLRSPHFPYSFNVKFEITHRWDLEIVNCKMVQIVCMGAVSLLQISDGFSMMMFQVSLVQIKQWREAVHQGQHYEDHGICE